MRSRPDLHCDFMIDQEFAGRCAIVTGSGRGIGKAVAEDLASAGARICLVSQSDSSRQVADAITASGGLAQAYVGSVADESFCNSVVTDCARRFGGPHILVNAAGTLGPSGKFSTLPMAEFAKTIAVNLLGPCYLIHGVLPHMESAGFGRIINFAGGGAAYSYPNFAPYGTSKAAIVRLTEIIADEITIPKITVNVIAPGAVATDMLAEVRRRGGEVRTTVDISEPVRLVHFLCSETSGHITGRFIHARDSYTDPSLFDTKDMLKLRRIERR